MAINRKVVVQLLADTTRFSAGMNNATASAGRLGSVFGKDVPKGMKLAGGAALGVGAAIAGGMAQGVRAYAGFEDKLNQSLAIMGNVSGQMRQEMSDTARDIATSTRFGADQAAEAYFFLASAGLDAEQSMAALPQVAAFAQAGMFDLATATDLATDAQSALGLSVDDPAENLQNLTRVTDVFVKANTLANTSVEQIAQAFTNKLGGSLRAVNKDIEEGSAVLAAYADQGLKGAAAGEAMNIMMRDLQKVGREAGDVLKENNIQIFDGQGNMRNFADIIADLEGAFHGLSDAQKGQLAQDLGFQDRSFKNIQLLLGNSEAIREYEKALRSASGVTEEIAGKQLESLSAQWDLLKSTVGDAALELGEQMAPALKELIPVVKDLAELLLPLAGFIGKVGAAAVDIAGSAVSGLKFIGQSVAGIWDEGARMGADMTVAMDKMKESIQGGAQPAAAFANSLNFLSQEGALTAENLEELGSSIQFVGYEEANALQGVLDLARARGDSVESITLLEDALYEQVAAAIAAGAAGEDLIEEWGLTDAAARAAADGADELGDSAEGSAAGMDTAREGATELEKALMDAADAQELLADALKAAADPAFAAVKAYQNYEETLEKVNEDGKVTAEEQLELAEAILEAQAALDSFDAEGVEKAADAIATALGISREEAAELLSTLGILDGTQVNTLIDIEQRVRNTGAKLYPENVITRGGATYIPPSMAREKGGPVTAGELYVVGEAGPEFFIPNTSGTVLPNGMAPPSGDRNLTVNFNNTTMASDPLRAVRQAFAMEALEGVV